MTNLDELRKKAETGIAVTGVYTPPTPRELLELIAEIERLREDVAWLKAYKQ